MLMVRVESTNSDNQSLFRTHQTNLITLKYWWEELNQQSLLPAFQPSNFTSKSTLYLSLQNLNGVHLYEFHHAKFCHEPVLIYTLRLAVLLILILWKLIQVLMSCVLKIHLWHVKFVEEAWQSGMQLFSFS